MAYRQDGPYLALPAGADFSALDPQYLGVTVDTNGQVQLVVAAGIRIAGILQDTPKAGGTATVQFRDVTKWLAGGTFSIGDLVMTNNAGRCVVATSTNFVVGRALQAGANNRVVAVQLIGQSLL